MADKEIMHDVHSIILRRVIDNWRHVPLALRQQYWRETDYGRLHPPFELLVAMDKAIGEKQTHA